MFKVSVNGTTLYARSGALLSDILMKSEVRSDHPCGGKGICKKCRVIVNGKQQLSCQYRVVSDIEVTVPDMDIVSASGAQVKNAVTDNMCLVLDLGTTTLALSLVNPDSNTIIKLKTATNPQRAYGGDVLTRIEYCNKNSDSELC